MVTHPNCQALQLDSPQSIRAYFEKIRELAKSGVEYPARLDDVWPIVYSAKEKAVRALRLSFIKDIDYQVLAKNGENPNGGRPEMCYSLSVPCLEFFIARKIREVFEVYRQVFHRVVDAAEKAVHVPQAGLIQLINDQTGRIISLERKISAMNRARVQYFKARVVDRVRKEEQKQKTDAQKQRAELFELFERYMKVHHFQDGETVLDSVLNIVARCYYLDLRIQKRSPGEHYFDVAIRFGKGHCIAEVIKSHMYKSGSLK